jgi:RHH-type rel operon transcriptional repressor/antitoxin RelB
MQLEDKAMLTITLPAALEARLKAVSVATGRPVRLLVREALKRSLDDIKDGYLADAAYARFVASGKKATPLEAVMREYAGQEAADAAITE